MSDPNESFVTGPDGVSRTKGEHVRVFQEWLTGPGLTPVMTERHNHVRISRALGLAVTCRGEAHCGWRNTHDGVRCYYWTESQTDVAEIRNQTVLFEDDDDMFVKACLFLKEHGWECRSEDELDKARHEMYGEIHCYMRTYDGYDDYVDGKIVRDDDDV